MKLTKVCAWCDKVLFQGDPDAEISHGICPECVEVFLRRDVDTLQTFIDRLSPPVLLVDASATVLTANLSAQRAIGKDLALVRGFRGGDVMECAYARRPEGCGNTEHCIACTIRNTVMDTHEDGMSRKNVEAFQDIQRPGGKVRMRFLISTAIEGNIVLLRIEEMQPASEAVQPCG